MSDRLGMCPNIGNCEIADERQRLPIDPLTENHCPSCGRSLLPMMVQEEEQQPRRRSRRPVVWVAGAVVVVAALLLARPFFPAMPRPEAPVVMTLVGSNTIGAHLARTWVAGFLARKGYVETTETVVQPDEVLVTGRRPNSGDGMSILVKAHGSQTAFEALKAGTADLGMASRAIDEREFAGLSKLGDMRAASNEHVVALDGVAVIVHRSNPVAKLSLAQLGDIFSGKVISWSQLGGPSLPIKVYARDDKSGTWDTFRSLVLAPANQVLVPSAVRIEDSTALTNAVAADVGGIGFIGLPYVGPTKALAVLADTGTQPIYPNRFTVATEDYPLARRLYLYTSTTPPPLVNELLTYVESREGQNIVQKEGFVALTLEGLPSKDVSEEAQYTKVTAGYARLSTNFHFRLANSDLDSKALHDLDGVVDFIARSGKRMEVMLLGFADNSGNPMADVALSRARASAVALELSARGVPVAQAIGMGAELSVAPNDTVEQRNRNRRVEILVKGLN